MAAVPVTITGTMTGKDGSENVTIVGFASLTGLGVGGGPIEPPDEGPPSIWPSPGHPEHPIYLPPGIWPDPPEGSAPHPEHPIQLPPPPGTDGPPLEVKAVWTEENGWFIVLVPTEEAPPHPTPSQRPGASAPKPTQPVAPKPAAPRPGLRR